QDKVEWQLDGGQMQALNLDQAEGDLWPVPLDLQRGRHTLRVRVTRPQPAGQATQEYLKELAVRYQAPAPRLELEKPGSYREVKQADFLFKALLHAPGQGPGVNVSLWLGDQKNPHKTWNFKRTDGRQEVNAMLKLK